MNKTKLIINNCYQEIVVKNSMISDNDDDDDDNEYD